MESTSLEGEDINRERKEESSISQKDASISKDSANQDDAVGEKFCGTENVNSNESIPSEGEQDTNLVYPNVPGNSVHSCT